MVSAVFHTPLDAAPHADKPATNSIAPSALSMSATAQNASKTAATTSTKASGRDLATWSRNFWMAALPPACGVALLLVAWAMVSAATGAVLFLLNFGGPIVIAHGESSFLIRNIG